MVRRYLTASRVEEISLRNGAVVDCRGCSYEACLHFGERGDCFYGGIMVEQVYPAVRQCDTLVLICPNYNDAVGANIMAFFNRLTALFRTDWQTFRKTRLCSDCFRLQRRRYRGRTDHRGAELQQEFHPARSFCPHGNGQRTEEYPPLSGN